MDATWSFERGSTARSGWSSTATSTSPTRSGSSARSTSTSRATAPTVLVVDLGEVDFVDSSAVRAFIRARRSHGPRLMIGALSDPVRRVFDIAGVTTLFMAEAAE